jgi:DNA-binding transcriptional ArsR family regulator
VFAALGDATRLRLVARLCEQGSMSIARLTAGADVSRQAITKHLRVLERAGLVRSTPRGRERLWQLQQRRLSEAQNYLNLISREWDRSLGRLKAFVEKPAVEK